jgi:hypothetical protein
MFAAIAVLLAFSPLIIAAVEGFLGMEEYEETDAL